MLTLALLASPSDAFELTVRQERALQIASVSTTYGSERRRIGSVTRRQTASEFSKEEPPR